MQLWKIYLQECNRGTKFSGKELAEFKVARSTYKRWVKDHAGWIAVESDVEKGSTFSVFIPVKSA